MPGRFVLCAGLLFLAGPVAARAPEPAYQEDMRFVNKLRAEHYDDLALEYLEKLRASNPPRELARELPLEIAKTRLRIVANEPDSGKRLALYGQVREEIQAFLDHKDNSSHPHRAGAKLDLARVSVMQARTQLSRALLQESRASQLAERRKARALFEEAGKQLAAAAKELDARVEKFGEARTPAEKAERKRLGEERLRAELDVARNVFDQAQTYAESEKEAVGSPWRDKVKLARAMFSKVAGGPPASPAVWEARAWVGRCDHELGELKAARERFAEVIGTANTPAAADGLRLARYFRLLVIRETPPEGGEQPGPVIVEAAERWIKDYPNHARTPEGLGIRWLLARVLIEEAGQPRVAGPKREADLRRARALLKEIEQTENDFTDLARRKKIEVIARQTGFTRPVEQLTTFDDCYTRAQYEMFQMGKEGVQEEERKKHLDTLIAALERGLKQVGPKAKPGLEVNNARAMLAYFCLGAGKYEEAIRVGEGFARTDPKASQASTCASYALEAYAKRVAGRDPEEVKDDRDRMLELAKYMEQRWPRELAGDLARHQTGLLLIREKKYPEAVVKLAEVSPAYPSYAFAQYQLAGAAFQAEKDRLEPIPGDKPGDYHRRAVAALERIPESALGTDPATNQVVLMGRARLGREWFKAKKYDAMDRLAGRLLKELPSLRTNPDPQKDRAIRKRMEEELKDIQLYAFYGKASAAFAARKYAEVAGVLDKAVKEFNAGEQPGLKKNQPLARAIFDMDLRSNVLLGNIAQTQAVLKALQTMAAEEGGEAGATAILRQLAGLIRKQMAELRKKGDKEELKKAVANFSKLLAEVARQQARPAPEFTLLLAGCYDGMDQHAEAAKLLDKIAAPPAGAPPQDLQVYQGARLLLARQLRLGKQPDKAREVLDEALGTPGKPGWGARKIDVLKEKVYLLIEEKKFAEAARQANSLVRQLLSKVNTDNALKEHYLECYYLQVYCVLKHGQGLEDPAKRAKEVKNAALLIAQLEKRWDDLGGDVSRKRFTELLDQEKDLKEAYEQVKTK